MVVYFGYQTKRALFVYSILSHCREAWLVIMIPMITCLVEVFLLYLGKKSVQGKRHNIRMILKLKLAIWKMIVKREAIVKWMSISMTEQCNEKQRILECHDIVLIVYFNQIRLSFFIQVKFWCMYTKAGLYKMQEYISYT
jgi:type III secretory pathway component EscT